MLNLLNFGINKNSGLIKTNILLNSKMIIDSNEDGKADNWTMVKNASHEGIWSIDEGQLFDLSSSGPTATASYLYQSGLVGSNINIVGEVEVKTVGNLNIHVQMRYRQGSNTLDSVITGYSSYENFTKIKLSGTTPDNTDNVALFIFLYNTANATGQFFIKNGKLLI